MVTTTARTPTAHIWLDESNVAWIDDTNTKVIEVVQDRREWSLTPEEIRDQHVHLSMAQIHAALSYYYDHQEELDAEIEGRYGEVQRLKAEAGPSALAQGLRDAGLLR